MVSWSHGDGERMNDTSAWVGRQIRNAREQLGLHQSDLARLLERTQTAVSYWESGKRVPGLDDLLELSDALQQDVSYFIPRVNRQPIRAILRAKTAQLDHEELYEVLQEMVNEAEAKPFPRREIKVLATRPARAAQELLVQEHVQEPPIDVERIASRCGVQVVKRHFNDDLSGLLIALDEGAIAGVNDTQHEHRQRFTIGHELGHYLLNHHDRFHIDLGPNAEHGDPPGYDWQSERAANQFAANLLMPSTLVHEAYAEDDSTTQLAHRFKVSELAMGYRLIELGLR